MAEDAQVHPSDASSRVPTSSNEDLGPSSVPKNLDLPALQYPLFPMMYHQTLRGFFPFQSQEQNNHGGGIYAISTMPFTSPLPGVPPPVALIPLTYSIPTRPASTDSSNEGQRQEVPQQHAPERQIVVRRFQIGFQLDLLLILKLAAVVFVFSQDGSKERLFFLLLFASIIYLYQTGALTPVIRWLSQWVQQAIAPRQPPVRQRNEQDPAPAEGNAGPENVNQPPNADAVNGANWWGIAKEIQMIVVGFVTSLLPGFHNVD